MIPFALVPIHPNEIYCIVCLSRASLYLVRHPGSTRTIFSVLRFDSLDRVSDLMVFTILKVCSQMYVLPKREKRMIAEAAEAIAVE